MSQEHGTPTHWWGSNVTVQIFINTGLVQFCDLPVNISHFLNSERIHFFKLSRDIELENFRVTDYCRGQQSHHHVNHIIMSTTSSSSSREMNSDEFRLEKALAEVGSVFPQVRASICKSSRQQAHRTVARARFALENEKKTLSSLHLVWKMRSAKCARDCLAKIRIHIEIVKNLVLEQLWICVVEFAGQNAHETVARARFHITIFKNWGFQRGLWICVVEFLPQNVYETAARAWFHINIVKCSQHQSIFGLEDAVDMVSIFTVMSTILFQPHRHVNQILSSRNWEV